MKAATTFHFERQVSTAAAATLVHAPSCGCTEAGTPDVQPAYCPVFHVLSLVASPGREVGRQAAYEHVTTGGGASLTSSVRMRRSGQGGRHQENPELQNEHQFLAARTHMPPSRAAAAALPSGSHATGACGAHAAAGTAAKKLGLELVGIVAFPRNPGNSNSSPLIPTGSSRLTSGEERTQASFPV